MDKKILVTGATGFVGSYLLRQLLAQGARQLYALRRAHSRMDLVRDIEQRVQWITGDVLDIPLLHEVLQDMDQVYHCAGVVSFDPVRAGDCMRVNVQGTENVVNAALAQGIEKMAHISSIAALGRPRHLKTLDESFVWERSKRNTRYAISKFLGEQEVWRGIAEGLNAVILNPSIILGSGRWNEGSNRFFQWVRRGLRFYPPGSAGFVDVRDVASLAVQLMESEISGERFVVNARNMSFRELLNLIADALDRPRPIFPDNRLLRGLAWRGSVLKARLLGGHPLLTRESAMVSSLNYAYDNTKSREHLDFTYLPIEETVLETANQFCRARSTDGQAAWLPAVPA